MQLINATTTTLAGIKCNNVRRRNLSKGETRQMYVSYLVARLFFSCVLDFLYTLVKFYQCEGCTYLMLNQFFYHAGALFSAIASVEVLCAVVASVLFNSVYSATVEWHPGFCFFVIATVLVVPIFILL